MKESLTGKQLCKLLGITRQQLTKDAKDLPGYTPLWEKIKKPNDKTVERILAERQQAVHEMMVARGQPGILDILDRTFTPEEIKILKAKHGIDVTPSAKPAKPSKRQRYRKQPQRVARLCKRYREKHPNASLSQIWRHREKKHSYKSWRNWLLEFTGTAGVKEAFEELKKLSL